MQIGDASKGIACWLYTNKRYGDQCVQFVQGLMPLDHWTEQPLGVLADAEAMSAEIAQVRQAAINEGLEMAADHADKIGFPDVAEDIRSMKSTSIETGEHLKDSQAPGDAV